MLARISDIYKKYIWRLKMALQKSFFFKFKLIYTNVLLVIRLSSKIFSTDKMQSFNYILHYIYLFILETFVPTTLKYLQYWICVPTLTSLPVLEYIFKKFTIRCRNIICIYLLLILNLEHNSTLTRVHKYLSVHLIYTLPQKIKMHKSKSMKLHYFFLPSKPEMWCSEL